MVENAPKTGPSAPWDTLSAWMWNAAPALILLLAVGCLLFDAVAWLKTGHFVTLTYDFLFGSYSSNSGWVGLDIIIDKATSFPLWVHFTVLFVVSMFVPDRTRV